MQVYVVIDITDADRKASVGVSPNRWSQEPVTGGSVEEARATHDVLGQAILFAQTINGFANKLEG